MPIFELDEGRARQVQPMQPLAGTFVSEVRALLGAQLAAVIGEAIFPVRARPALPEHVDAPELLALDAGGRPLVIEATQVVDDDALVAALRHAGAAGRMTSTDLTRAYHPDPTRFAADFAAFREQAPFGPVTTRRDGARLVLLCAEVAPEATDTLATLCGPGRQVTVLQLGVLRGADDRRWLAVAPLALHEPVRRSVEPTGLRLVRSAAQSDGAPTRPAAAPPAISSANRAPTSRREVRAARLDIDSITMSTSRVAAPPGPALVPPPQMPPAPSMERSGVAVPELACLAKSRHAVTLLVWSRERRGQRFEAMLRGDGLLQMPDGSVFADPDAAAAHAAGGASVVDGWRAWRLGAGGPTLAEAARR